MKRNLVLLTLLCLGQSLFAQYVYTINADSVKITNHCDTAELIIENHTQTVPGFLFNKGRGRTEFRRVVTTINDSTFLLGMDTIHTNRPSYWKANGNHIYNTNTGNVGIHRMSPKVLLDLPGPVNIDDTSAYRIGYHPVLRVNGYIDSIPDDGGGVGPGVAAAAMAAADEPSFIFPKRYTNIYVGDSAGMHNTHKYSTFVGGHAGLDNVGEGNTFVGYVSGQNNSPGPGGSSSNSGANSFFGAFAGQDNSGGGNTFIGNSAGQFNQGADNTFIGNQVGAASSSGSQNCVLGSKAALLINGSLNASVGFSASTIFGDRNCFFGAYSGSAGRGNSYFGFYTGAGLSSGDNNVVIGDSAAVFINGSGNTAVGALSLLGLSENVTRNNVTLVGSSSRVGALYGDLSNATALGANAFVNASNTMVFGDTAVKTWLFNSGAIPTSGMALVVGSNATNGNGAYLTTGGVWTNASDINKKEEFETLNNTDVLERIVALPVTRWKYKGLPEWHIGPVAQDFYRLFRVGTDDKTISTIDPSGIALAGIQELHRKWKAAEAQVKEQQAQVDKLQLQVQEQQAQMAQLLEKFNQLERVVNAQKK